MQGRKIEERPNGNVLVRVPISIRWRYSQKRIITPDGMDKPMNDSLLTLIASGRRWQAFIDDGKFKNARDRPRPWDATGAIVPLCCASQCCRPRSSTRSSRGEASAMMTVEFLRSRLPVLWDDQMTLLFK